MTYSPELIKFATASTGHNLISRTGALTKLGERFSQLLEGYSLTFPEALTLTDIRWLVLRNQPPRYCRCGGLISGSALARGAIYCGMSCYKKDKSVNEKISLKKRQQYADPEIKSRIEKKKRDTNMARLGVEHPMQNPEVFAKHEKASVQSYTHRGISGLRGYEKYVVDWLVDQKGMIPGKDIVSGVSAKRIFGHKLVVAGGHRFPDLYVVPWNTYIEVKGPYTLSKFEIGKEMIEVVEDVGSDYMVVLVDKGKISVLEEF